MAEVYKTQQSSTPDSEEETTKPDNQPPASPGGWPPQSYTEPPRPGTARPPQQYGAYEAPSRGNERAARLTLTCLAASFGVLVIGLVVFFTVRTLRQSDDVVSGEVETPTVTTPEDAARIVGGIGPPHGVELGAYGDARKAALASATGDRVAVVTLAKYTNEAKARAAVGQAEVLALLAAAPGGAPSLVTTPIAAWANAQTAEARAERDEIQKLIPTVKDDPQFQNFYKTEVERLNKLISATKPDGDLVFAVVVRAPSLALQELGRKPDVRLVDVGPTAEPDPRGNYRGVRPEETAKSNEPNTRPV